MFPLFPAPSTVVRVALVIGETVVAHVAAVVDVAVLVIWQWLLVWWRWFAWRMLSRKTDKLKNDKESSSAWNS